MTDSAPKQEPPYGLRMPPDLKDRVKAAAEANNRSMNAEIVAVLEDRYPDRGKAEVAFAKIRTLLAEMKGRLPTDADIAKLDEYQAEYDAAVKGLPASGFLNPNEASDDDTQEMLDRYHRLAAEGLSPDIGKDRRAKIKREMDALYADLIQRRDRDYPDGPLGPDYLPTNPDHVSLRTKISDYFNNFADGMDERRDKSKAKLVEWIRGL